MLPVTSVSVGPGTVRAQRTDPNGAITVTPTPRRSPSGVNCSWAWPCRSRSPGSATHRRRRMPRLTSVPTPTPVIPPSRRRPRRRSATARRALTLVFTVREADRTSSFWGCSSDNQVSRWRHRSRARRRTGRARPRTRSRALRAGSRPGSEGSRARPGPCGAAEDRGTSRWSSSRLSGLPPSELGLSTTVETSVPLNGPRHERLAAAQVERGPPAAGLPDRAGARRPDPGRAARHTARSIAEAGPAPAGARAPHARSVRSPAPFGGTSTHSPLAPPSPSSTRTVVAKGNRPMLVIPPNELASACPCGSTISAPSHATQAGSGTPAGRIALPGIGQRAAPKQRFVRSGIRRHRQEGSEQRRADSQCTRGAQPPSKALPHRPGSSQAPPARSTGADPPFGGLCPAAAASA